MPTAPECIIDIDEVAETRNSWADYDKIRDHTAKLVMISNTAA